MTQAIIVQRGSGYIVVADGSGLLSSLIAQASGTVALAQQAVSDVADIIAEQNAYLFEQTRNLFDGVYYPWRVDGSGPPGTGALYNDEPEWRTALVPVQSGVQYYVKSAEPTVGNIFRIAVHTEQFPEFNNVGVVLLTEYIYREDTVDEYGFTSPLTGWAFITVSNNEAEPLLQVEVGSVPTEYIEPFKIKTNSLPERVAEAPDRLDDVFDLATARSRNLFNGIFRVFSVGGVPDVVALAFTDTGQERSAWAPIESGKTYTIKVHSAADNFRVVSSLTLPDDILIGQSQVVSEFLEFNDILKQFTFTASINGFVLVGVSSSGQTPDVQIEESAVATDYVPYLIAKQVFVDEAIANNLQVKDVQEKCACALERLDQNMLFPSAVDASLTGTDPGPRFVEYFDDKMWGYTFLTGDISYSDDEGLTWTIRTNVSTTPGEVPQRLLPTDDGEVLLMSPEGVYKSSGWTGVGAVTWSASKVTLTAGAVLFQFAIDGDGTKFILAEYALGTPNWQNSRKVWISTNEGDTFTVVWDSLTQHGAPLNANTHLHGVVYDRFADRFYLSEGHGPKGGLYCSEDDGATWLRAEGYHNGVLASENVIAAEGDTNGPTVLVATPTGLVMGSDNENNGVYGLVRKPDPLDEVVKWNYAEPIFGSVGVAMFAVRGFLDETSGMAFITFRTERNEQAPIICAGDPTQANLVYRHPTLPVEGGSDQFGAIAKTSNDRLVAYAQFAGVPYTLRADLEYPASGIQTIIRAELKKLGLIT